MKTIVHERINHYCKKDITGLFQAFETGLFGLPSDVVEEHQSKYGENRQIFNKETEYTDCLKRAFLSPFSLILFGIGVLSFITNVIFEDGHYGQGASTVIIIFAMLIISGALRFYQELRTKRIADRLTDLIRTTVPVCRDGVWLELESDELVVGDLIRMDPGDRVPADVRIIKATDFFVSQSVITGESKIMEKFASVLEGIPTHVSAYTNIAFFGTTVVGGSATGIVLAVGKDTLYGSIGEAKVNKVDGYDEGAKEISGVLIKFMAILLPVVFVASGVTKNDWSAALIYALSVAIGLTPELLPMVVNNCLAKSSVAMGKNQTIVKNINAMQEFGGMDVLCVDKTGTLTGDRVQLEYFTDILGNESQKTLDYAYLNSHFHSGVSNHLDAAILDCETMPGKEFYFEQLASNYSLKDEEPFDYSRKYASVMLGDEQGGLHIIKGSVDAVVSNCGYVEYKGVISPITEDGRASAHEIVDEMTGDGMKVIAVAYKEEKDESFILLGYLSFFDGPKASAARAIENIQKLGVDVRVLTGDDKNTTISVCRRLGLPTSEILTGNELMSLSDNDFNIVVEKTKIFTDLTPGQKARVVDILRANGHKVGFLGDGMNDLPAELVADVGISVDTAVEAMKEGADIILLKKDLNVLEQGIIEGRRAFVNMSKYIRITASSNFGNICAIVVAGVLLPFFPMTSVQILLLNLLYDVICLILPWDNVDEELLAKPTRWNGKRLGRFMLHFGPISSFFDILTYAFLFFVLCPSVCGGSFATLDAAAQAKFIMIFHTGWFLESLWSQVLILHTLRTQKIPFLQSRATLPVGFITVMGVIIFTLLTLSSFGALLGLTAMPGLFYIFLIAVVFCYLMAVTFAKLSYFKYFQETI